LSFDGLPLPLEPLSFDVLPLPLEPLSFDGSPLAISRVSPVKFGGDAMEPNSEYKSSGVACVALATNTKRIEVNEVRTIIYSPLDNAK
jgi:hypothetical protein